MDKLIFLIPVLTLVLIGIEFSEGQGNNNNSPPKADIFSKQTSNNAILVTWENPDDTADNIVFRYTVSRDINKTDNFVPIFNSLRNIEEKIINEHNGQEMFFYLDEDIKPGSFYTYQISAGRSQGNPNPVLSDDTRPIFIEPNIKFIGTKSKAHLITDVTLTPIPPSLISFNFDWLFQDANAVHDVNPIFTTTLNPQNESYLLALEPVTSNTNVTNSFVCDQVLRFKYSNSNPGGQNFNVLVSITENIDGVQVVKHQELFNRLTTSDKRLFSEQLAVSHSKQVIQNFTGLQVQFDINGTEGDPRNLSIWYVDFKIPQVIGNC